jgi:hypothetical protein
MGTRYTLASTRSVTPHRQTRTMTTQPLTDTERKMLEFARLSWTYEGARESAIREQFGMSRDVYSLKLVRLIDTEAAMAFDPITCRRLRDVRDRRRVA